MRCQVLHTLQYFIDAGRLCSDQFQLWPQELLEAVQSFDGLQQILADIHQEFSAAEEGISIKLPPGLRAAVLDALPHLEVLLALLCQHVHGLLEMLLGLIVINKSFD